MRLNVADERFLVLSGGNRSYGGFRSFRKIPPRLALAVGPRHDRLGHVA
jgi:hypothetical protein